MAGDNTEHDAEKAPEKKNEDHSKHSIGARIGEFLILGLYLVIDAVEIWPHHPVLALVASPIGTIALLLIFGGISTKSIAITGVAASAMCVVIYFAVPADRVQETQITFKLLPSDEATPDTGCSPSASPKDRPYQGVTMFYLVGERPKEGPPKDATIVALGNNGIILTGDKRVPILGVDECKSLISVQRTPDGISINVNIYDRDGKLAARIQDNVLTALNANELQISQEGSLNTIVARDGIGERLWVRYLNAHALKIRGIFICLGGNGVIQVTDKGSMLSTKKVPEMGMEWGNQCTTDAAALSGSLSVDGAPPVTNSVK
jgi:hypothetical protein